MSKMSKHAENLRLKNVDLTPRIASESEYLDELSKIQQQLVQLQNTYFHEKRRAVVVFEGWDAAGKGGIIRRLTATLDPRGFRVHPISAPTPDEQGRHYLYRFWARLPKPGTTAIFDRSWYGRVLVERVEEFASKDEWQRAYKEINQFEKQLTDDGVRIVKIFVHISQEEQARRFRDRLLEPSKRWKLTEEDIRNRERWADYEEAIDDMFAETSTSHCPWHIIAGNQKWSARIEALNLIFKQLSKDLDLSVPPIDPKIVAEALTQLGFDEPSEHEEKDEGGKKKKKHKK